MAEIDPKDIQSEVEDFFNKCGIVVKAKVAAKDGDFIVDLDTKESGLLIGHHGDTLQDFQTVLNLILNNKYKQDNWVRYVLDIGGWRQEREDDIKDITLKAIEKVRATGEPFTLAPMKPSERRTVHLVISEQDDLLSESSGTGPDRRITISLKS